MSKKTRRRLDAELKAEVARGALRNEATAPSGRRGTNPTRIRFLPWKNKLADGAAGVFVGGMGKEAACREAGFADIDA
jgi:transposase